MKIPYQEVLKIRLNHIFNSYTQSELATELKIDQWKLLEKMKDNSFTIEETLLIEKISNLLLLKPKKLKK